MNVESRPKLRASVIKVPDSTPGLLFVDGRQLPFTLQNVWHSPVAPAANMTVDVELAGADTIVSIAVVDQQQLAKERLHQIGGVAQEHGKQAADIAKQGVYALALRMGKVAFGATVVLWLAWFFLPFVKISFFVVQRSFTFWQLLALNPENFGSANPESRGLVGFIGLLCIAGPFAVPFVAHARAKLLGALPLAFLLFVVLRVWWRLREVTSAFGGGGEEGSMISGLFDAAQEAVTIGIGAYALVIAAVILAVQALRARSAA